MTSQEKWLRWLEEEKEKDYYKRILRRVNELEKETLITPSEKYVMRALNFSNIDDIKVILTADRPFRESYAADGLAFSSLDESDREMQNLYKLLYNELNIVYDQQDNDKTKWEKQGILLLNRELSQPEGYHNIEPLWSQFTRNVIRYFLDQEQPRAFIFMDSYFRWEQELRSNLSPQHLIIHNELKGSFFFNIATFNPVNEFIRNNYSYVLNWN